MRLRIREAVSSKYDFNYLLDKYEFPDYAKYENDKNVFYHNTGLWNVDSISKHGLKCDLSKAERDIGGILPIIWATNTPYGSKYGGCTIVFRYDLTKYNGEKVNDSEYTLSEDVPPEDILFIDTWICNDNSLFRVSDAPRLIKKMGDRYRNTLEKKYENPNYEFFYDLNKLFDSIP